MTTIASATPGASRVPKAEVTGKLAAGWLTAAAVLADLGLGAGVAGDLLYGSGANTLARLPIATAGRVLVAGASAPAWSDSGLSYASSVLTVAGSVPGTPAAGQVFIGGGQIKAGGAVTIAGAITHSGVNTASGSTASRLAYFGGTSGDGAAIELRGSTYSGSPDTGFLRVGGSYIANWSTAGITLQSGSLVVTNGSAAAPGLKTSEGHGLYRASATTLGLAAAGLQALVVGGPGGTFGAYAFFNTPSAAEYSSLYNSRTDTYMGISGGTGPANSGGIRLYGGTHATKADRVEFTRGATVSAYFDGSGNMVCSGTLSATSLTATGLTPTYIPYATTGGLLTNDAGFTRVSFSGGLYTKISTTVTGTGTGYGMRLDLTSDPSGTNSGTIQGAEFTVQSNAANANNFTSSTWGIAGFIASGQHYGSGTAASVIGAGFGPVARPGCGVVASMAGFKCLLQNLHTTQAVTLGVGAEIASPSNAGGNFVTYKGINIAAAAVGTTNCIGIDIGAMTGTGPFAIRTAAGIVSIGDTTDASAIGTAAHVVAGGGSFAKSLWVGGTAGNYINIANATGELRVAGTKVVAARKTGWTAQTATAARTDLGAAPTVGAIASFLRALYDDLAGHGLIGA